MRGPRDRDELETEYRELASARAELEAASGLLAIGEQTGVLIPRLEQLAAELGLTSLDDEGAGEPGGRKVFLVTDLLRTIAKHDRRPASPAEAHRWASLRHGWAARRVTDDSPELDELEEKAFELLADVPGRADEAIDGMRRLIARREDREPEGVYAISLRRLSLVRMLSRRGADGDVAEALALLVAETAAREEAYGKDHPFTLVALGRRLLTELTVIEASTHHRAVGEALARAEALVPDARRLVDTRLVLLGERNSATVKAMGYLARLRLAADDAEDAERWARRAVAAAPDRAPDPGEPTHAVHRVVLAQALARRGMPGLWPEAQRIAAEAETELLDAVDGPPWLARIDGLEELYRTSAAARAKASGGPVPR